MKVITYLLVAAVIILILAIGYTIIVNLLEMNNLVNRVEDSVIAAGWTGFSMIDLDEFSKRLTLEDSELRKIHLNKEQAQTIVKAYISKNLKLDATGHPKSESFIACKTHPFIIKEMYIYNPDELPAICNGGNQITRTSIHIIVQIPFNIKWVGFRYLEKHVDVDVKSFDY